MISAGRKAIAALDKGRPLTTEECLDRIASSAARAMLLGGAGHGYVVARPPTAEELLPASFPHQPERLSR